MKKHKSITITLKITDSETVEDYKDVHMDLILDDIRHGSLAEVCEIVDVIHEQHD